MKLLAFLTAMAAWAAEPVAFIQISDPQFGMYSENREFAQETANFEFAIATANRLMPAFVIVTGDLINQAGNQTQTAEYLRIAKKLDHRIKLYNVPGNHDVGNEPTPESLELYRKRFGRDYYSFRHGTFAGIVLNSSLIHSPAKAQAEYAQQESFLQNELTTLKASGATQIVVFQHHPFFLKSSDEPDQYFNIPLERRRIYLALLKRFGVATIFAGHYHRNEHGQDGPLEMVTTGPVGKPLGDARSGMRIAVVSENSVRHEYHDLALLPNSIKLK